VADGGRRMQSQRWNRELKKHDRILTHDWFILTFLLLLRLSCLQCSCLQCFDAVGWVAGRHPACKKTEWWGAGVVICLERGADLHMAKLMPLPLTISCFSKIQIGFTFVVLALNKEDAMDRCKWRKMIKDVR